MREREKGKTDAAPGKAEGDGRTARKQETQEKQGKEAEERPAGRGPFPCSVWFET